VCELVKDRRNKGKPSKVNAGRISRGSVDAMGKNPDQLT
jgi:hypothetical protein